MSLRRVSRPSLLRRIVACLAATLWLWQAMTASASAAMPSVSVTGERVALVICTSHGLQKVILDGEGNVIDSGPADDGRSGGHDCPCVVGCCGLAVTLPEGVFAAQATFVAASAVAVTQQAVFFPPARGPPLGSRAPPQSLGRV